MGGSLIKVSKSFLMSSILLHHPLVAKYIYIYIYTYLQVLAHRALIILNFCMWCLNVSISVGGSRWSTVSVAYRFPPHFLTQGLSLNLEFSTLTRLSG